MPPQRSKRKAKATATADAIIPDVVTREARAYAVVQYRDGTEDRIPCKPTASGRCAFYSSRVGTLIGIERHHGDGTMTLVDAHITQHGRES